MSPETERELSTESRHRHDHLVELAARARDAGLDDVAEVWERERDAIADDESLEDDDTDTDTEAPPEITAAALLGDPVPGAFAVSPSGEFALSCPGCGNELARVPDSEARSYSGRCAACDVPHSEITTAGVPAGEDASPAAVDAETAQLVLDQWWADRVRDAVLEGETDRAKILAQFWFSRASRLGWTWMPPSELAVVMPRSFGNCS